MRLEVGKFYKTRNGEKAEVVYIAPADVDSLWPVFTIRNNRLDCHALNGGCSDGVPRLNDLIAEWDYTSHSKYVTVYRHKTDRVFVGINSSVENPYGTDDNWELVVGYTNDES